MKTIFITYNPKSKQEQTLAMRLHTIGAVNDFTMFLPDRTENENEISESSKSRIARCDYFIIFSTNQLSTVVKQEIELAFKYLNDKSKILVIYDKQNGKNLTGDIVEHFTPFYFDQSENKQDLLLQKIIGTIKEKEVKRTNSNALAAILGIGLGLLILGSLSENKK
ncbi:MAG: hypothetical protein EAZ53_08635 [Bacteroidetes bacterium]|nr:MAG: hypothetical protein EAZ53_08635 [Bacteroidota bacterium]